jgi:hypothetical protein
MRAHRIAGSTHNLSRRAYRARQRLYLFMYKFDCRRWRNSIVAVRSSHKLNVMISLVRQSVGHAGASQPNE